MTLSRRLLITLAVAAVALAPAATIARGSVRVQQSDGRIKWYQNAGLQLDGNTLRIVSPDRVGTLSVQNAACSFRNGLRRCYPYQFTLQQHGMHVITLRRGTLYLNVSDAPHRLPHSSKIIAAHSVLASLETQRGTYISINGQLDEVKP
jgi:hypothetical protein